MADNKPVRREYRTRRVFHFDLSDAALKYFKLDSATVYHAIRVWMKNHGMDHDQLSGYVSRLPITRRESDLIMDSFIHDFPQVAACVEGMRITRYEQGREMGPFILDQLRTEYPEYVDIAEQSQAIRTARNQGKRISKGDLKDFIHQSASTRTTDASSGKTPPEQFYSI
ncbi:hypothetical protein [Scardovia wiggsiae]|uniref:hypothetical protein n=1 Tax=Scardovia wiggsiae TaxID=230143 RepID=UPI00374F1A2A